MADSVPHPERDEPLTDAQLHDWAMGRFDYWFTGVPWWTQ